ncbi:CK5P3 protein, partial [Sakesphorus luctuosus]|nr:CK5P3 protein [Sakesphorus luctuosus]
LHYFHCLRIVEILKGTEASTKNLFGRYSSQRMRDWQEIVALYEKENTYLAELSSLLVRSISYEIPSLRRQLGRCQQAQQDFSRREDECQLGAAELRERFLGSCRQYGISVSARGAGHPKLPPDRPHTAPKYTPDWPQWGVVPALMPPPWWPPSPGTVVVPLLRHVASRGNTTVFEWRTGQEPRRVERPQLREEPEPPGEDAIDWGDFTLEPTQVGDGAAADGGAQDEEIDWGITVEPSAQDDGIDWGDGEAEQVQITVLEAGSEVPEGVACGSDALTLLENPETRNQFIDELMEVGWGWHLGWLWRCPKVGMAPGVALEMSCHGNGTWHAQGAEGVPAVPPRYVDRVTELLRQKLRQAELLLAKKEAMAQKRQEALAEQGSLEPKLDRLLEKTKELQKLIEADISKRYGGRPVNLMGINL